MIEYYKILHQKKLAGEHNLTVATIFSYGANVDLIDSEEFERDWEEGEFGVTADLDRGQYDKTYQKHPREYLDEFIGHYQRQVCHKLFHQGQQAFLPIL